MVIFKLFMVYVGFMTVMFNEITGKQLKGLKDFLDIKT